MNIHIPVSHGVPNADTIPNRPSCFDEMISLSEKLSDGINNVRVDLYEIEGRVYFSEMTFYPNGGMEPFEPYEYDVELGKHFILEKYTE